MKLLLLFTHDYWLKPYEKSLAEAPESTSEVASSQAMLALVHVEAHDPERQSKLVTKAIKNVKWLSGKFNTRNVVLHSFAHLAATRAEPEQAEAILSAMRERLAGAGYQVRTTPFGYFNEFRVHVAGPSLAKVFVEL
jgi:D-Tyr-tRNAtyr deacylase